MAATVTLHGRTTLRTSIAPGGLAREESLTEAAITSVEVTFKLPDVPRRARKAALEPSTMRRANPLTTVVPGVPSLPIDVAIPREGGHPNGLVLEDGFILFMDTSAILLKIADVLTTNVPFERFDYF